MIWDAVVLALTGAGMGSVVDENGSSLLKGTNSDAQSTIPWKPRLWS